MIRHILRVLFSAYVGAMYLFLVLPVLIVVLVSFSSSKFIAFPPDGFSLQAYYEFFGNTQWTGSFLTSLKLAVYSAVLSGVVGSYAAIYVARNKYFGVSWIEWWFTSPLSVPHIVLALALLIWYANIGALGNFWSLLAGHVVITTPYVMRLVGSSISGFNWQLMDAASTLGARPLRAVKTILLPIVASGVAGGMILAFIISFDEILVSLFLSGPRIQTLPTRIYNYLDQSPGTIVAAAGSVLVFFSILSMAALHWLVGLSRVFGIPSNPDR